jgi:uncharacterized SAM-binding protein YcdF (DUF218 family)
MFFTLSKILWFFVQPSSLIAFGLLFGLWRLYILDFERARRWLAVSLVALIVCGFLPFSDLLFQPLEDRFPRAKLEGAAITGIIVLGGAVDARIAGGRQLIALNEAAERMTEAVALSRKLPQARVVFTGGSDSLMGGKETEADSAGWFFDALGVERSRVTLESQARNTAENASITKAMLLPKPGERWLLITSAWHMPRAIGCFRAVGFEVEAWPVDYRTVGRFDISKVHSSLPEGLRRIDFITREYLGLIAYWLTGKSNALLPAPR